MSEEWGPWIKHDGNGCPVKGRMVTSKCADGSTRVHIAHALVTDGFGNVLSGNPDCADSWDWADCIRRGVMGWRVVSYRVRKPRGMIVLQEILDSLPEPVREAVIA